MKKLVGTVVRVNEMGQFYWQINEIFQFPQRV